MNAAEFWTVIGNYNQNTIIVQFGLLCLLALLFFISVKTTHSYMIKIGLGITNLFIALVFFGYYGTEPIQKYFALPLYIIIGLLFLYEAVKNKKDRLTKISKTQLLLVILFFLYPFFSLMLGNTWPRMVTYIMPCPVVTLSIAIYCLYKIKNKVLLVCLTVWGLTGIKSALFAAWEDLILLFAGIYCLCVLIKQCKRQDN